MKKNNFFYLMAAAILFTAAMAGTAFAAGWQQDSKGYKWQSSDGTYLADTWQWTDGNKDGIAEYYYFGSDGYLLTNTTTIDGNQVNGDGAWVNGGQVQTKIISLKQGLEPYRKYVGTYHLYMEDYTEDYLPPEVTEDVNNKIQVIEDDGVIYIVSNFSYFKDDRDVVITKRIPLSDEGFDSAQFYAKTGPEYWEEYYTGLEENAHGYQGLFLYESFERYEFFYKKE